MDRLHELVTKAEDEYSKLSRGVKASSARCRKHLMDVMRESKRLRKECVDKVKSFPKKQQNMKVTV